MSAQIRGLTLRHPWPQMFLLDDEPKRLENRDWKPPSAMMGQLVALHGGALPKPGERKYLNEIQSALSWVGEIFEDPDAGVGFSDAELLAFCTPGIFGVARLVDVVEQSDDPWFMGKYGWVLADFVPIDPPVPHKGAQQLWEIEPDALATLRGRYRTAQAPAPAIAASEPPPWITAGPEPVSAACLAVLARVDRRVPLNRDDHAEVLALMKRELMHVTPEFDRTDKCPYRLTAAGQDALAQGRAA